MNDDQKDKRFIRVEFPPGGFSVAMSPHSGSVCFLLQLSYHAHKPWSCVTKDTIIFPDAKPPPEIDRPFPEGPFDFSEIPDPFSATIQEQSPDPEFKTLGHWVRNEEAYWALQMAKMLGCEWARDVEFPPKPTTGCPPRIPEHHE